MNPTTRSYSVPIRYRRVMRGVAVLMVVAFSLRPEGVFGWFRRGRCFLCRFPAISSRNLLVKEIQKTSKLNLLQFYARRVRRLLPASWLMLMVTLGFGALIMAPHELTFAARAARATAVYMSNIFFAVNASNYFAPDVKSNPMLHTWSPWRLRNSSTYFGRS